MKRLLSIYLCLLVFVAPAQMTTSLTGIPDTSFNNRSVYKKELKYHPGITLVELVAIKSVKQDTGMEGTHVSAESIVMTTPEHVKAQLRGWPTVDKGNAKTKTSAPGRGADAETNKQTLAYK